MEINKYYKFNHGAGSHERIARAIGCPYFKYEGFKFGNTTDLLVRSLHTGVYQLLSVETIEGGLICVFSVASEAPFGVLRFQVQSSSDFDDCFYIPKSLREIAEEGEILLYAYVERIIFTRMRDEHLTWSDLIVEYFADDEKSHHVVNAMLEEYELSEVLRYHRDAGYSLERFLSMVDGIGDHANYAMHHEDFCAVWKVALLQLIESSDSGDGAIWDICVLMELRKLSYPKGLLMARDELAIGKHVVLDFHSDYFECGDKPSPHLLNQEQFEAAMLEVYGITASDVLNHSERNEG